MGSIRRRGKYWYYYRSVNGKRICLALQVKTRRNAEKLCEELDLKYSMEKFGIRQIDSQRIEVFFKDYSKWIETSKSNVWSKRINSMIKNFMNFITDRKEKYLEDINFNTITDYYTFRKSKAGAKTIMEELRIIRRAIDHAVAEDKLESNDIEWVMFKFSISKNTHFPCFTNEDLHKIWDANLKDHKYYQVCYYTGLRSVDVGNLNQDNINREKNCIVIVTKKENVPGVIPIHNKIKWILKVDTTYIFPHLRTDSERHQAYKRLKKFIRENGINPRCNVHSFRHSFNMALLKLGMSYYDRKSLLAHSSMKSTMDYDHPDLELTRDYIDKID